MTTTITTATILRKDFEAEKPGRLDVAKVDQPRR